jgi:mannosyltransferase
VNFGDQIELTGYSLDSADEACKVTLYWQAPSTPGTDYSVFVHLVAKDGQIASQHDGRPVGGLYPTTMWKAGEVVADEHPISLPADTEPGDYRLLVGLYRPETGERLPVLGPGGQVLGDSTELPTAPTPY